MTKPGCLAFLIALCALSEQAPAGLILNLQESGSVINYTISGELNPNIFTSTSSPITVPGSGSVDASSSEFFLLGDPSQNTQYTEYGVNLFGSYIPFGTSGLQTTTGVSNGDLLGFQSTGGSDYKVLLAPGYNGEVVSGSGYWDGTYDSLGLTTGNYLISIEKTGLIIYVDSIAINVQEVPEPTSMAIFSLSTLLLLGRRKRRR